MGREGCFLRMEESTREMAHAGCTGTGKAGTQQDLRLSSKQQDVLLFAFQTAAVTGVTYIYYCSPVWDLRVVCC